MKKSVVKYRFTVNAVDIVIFTIRENELQVLLLKMQKPLFKKAWAAPGGLVRPQESLEKAAARILAEKTGLTGLYLEQLYTFGRVDRDPFGRVVSTAYFALLPVGQAVLTVGLAWFMAAKLPVLAYDHKEIIAAAVSRLRAKLAYTNIVYALMPKEFVLSDLQKTYEVILGRALDKRNFRKKILALKLLKTTARLTAGEAHRPAVLFRFIDQQPKAVQIL
jgi:8-oxo-dGTP diphosphatase